MSIKIALAGNPNSGKTTLFNALTGSNQFVGNWPGVTVEKKEGRLKGQKDVTIVDLPGIYSLSPYTQEEVVARNYLLEEKPDAILNIVDGTNLERNLYLSTQLMELGIPVVLAVNMMDLLEKRGDRIHLDKLEELLGAPVVEISALKGTGIREAAEEVRRAAERGKEPYGVDGQAEKIRMSKKGLHIFQPAVEEAVQAVEYTLDESSTASGRRFCAVKLLEKDEKIGKLLGIDREATCSDTAAEISRQIAALEKEFQDDTESIIANERYNFISRIMDQCCTKGQKEVLTVTDRIDRIVTNRFLALPIFAAVMVLVYYISVTTVGAWATDWANDGLFGEGFSFFGLWVPGIPMLIESGLSALGVAPWLMSLILDGIVAGVGAVLGFVPQMLVLFFFLAFLESCGYMARVAFIMDRLFRKFGLSGKSFIPMLIGSGCGVPGIMASRTIENDRDRKMTIMTTTFVPCSAKLPIIALIAGAFFHNAWWVAVSAYFVGITAIICSGIILKKTRMFAGEPAPFVMELPAYHMPTPGNVLRSMWERGFSFIKKAGTVILLSTIVLWFLMSFGWQDGSFGMLAPEQLDSSILAALGGILAPLFAPLGWGDWRMAVAAVTGLIAKENVVGTFGILFGYAQVAENGTEIWGSLALIMGGAQAYSFLVFNLLCAPCFAAMGAIRREMNNRKWFWFAIGYQTLLAYLAALCIYQVGSFFATGAFGLGTAVAILVILVFLYLLIKPGKEKTIWEQSSSVL